MGANICPLTIAVIAGFNPRTRDGCETEPVNDSINIQVSIHAPVMGANIFEQSQIDFLSFNPRTRDGCERGLI